MSPPSVVPQALSATPCALTEADAQWAREAQTLEPDLRTHLHRRFPTLNNSVDDIIQESVLRAWKARIAGTLRSIRGFLFTSAENAAFDLFRHNAVVKMESMTETHASSVASEIPNAAESAVRLDDLEVLKAVLADLPDGCRRILILRRIHGLSHKEISRRLGIAEHTVEKQVFLGVRRCMEYVRRKRIQWP